MRCRVALFALLAAGPLASAQPPARLDGNGEPLPAGAVARLGSAAGKPKNMWGGAVLSADGTKLLAPHSYRPATRLSRDHFTLYDAATLKPLGEPVLGEVAPGSNYGYSLAFAGDGSRLVGYCQDSVGVFDARTGRQLLRVPCRPFGPKSASLSADGKFVAMSDTTADKPGDAAVACAVWDVDAKRQVVRVAAAQNEKAGVTLSPDGKTLVTRGHDYGLPLKFAQVWDVATGKELARVPQLKHPYESAFSADSKLFAYHEVEAEATVVVEARTGKTRVTIPWDKEVRLGPIAFSPDGRTLAVLGPKVGRWDVATGKPLGLSARPAALPAHVRHVGLTYAGPDRLVAVSYRDHAAYAWEAVGGRLLSAPPVGLDTAMLAVAFAAGGKEVVTAGEHDTCRWDATTGAALKRLTVGGTDPGGRVALSADGALAFSAGFSVGEVRDLAADKPVGPRVAPKESGRANGAQFLTPDGSLLALLTDQGNAIRCLVIEVAGGKVVLDVTLMDRADKVAARLSADGTRLVVAYNVALDPDNRVIIGTWDAKTGAKLGERILPKAGWLSGFTLLDATHAVLGTYPAGVRVLDLVTGGERDLPDPSRFACEALEVSPDGKLVAVQQATRGRGRHVRIYELATGKVRATLGDGVIVYDAKSYSGPAIPSSLAFSPDGTKLVTPETETTALVWDVPAAK